MRAILAALLWAALIPIATAGPIPPPSPVPGADCAAGAAVTGYPFYGALFASHCGTPVASGTINLSTVGQIGTYTGTGTITGFTPGGDLSFASPNFTITAGAVTGSKIASSVALAGAPTTTTASTADSSTKIATTAYVQAQGYLIGNQTITFSGDVSGSGSTSVPLTIGAGAITAAKLATGAASANIGSLAGDLTGVLPSPTVAKIQGRPVSALAPTIGQVLSFDGVSWIPGPGGGGGGGGNYNPANVLITGGTIGGTLVTGLPTPVNAGDAASKAYVDGVAVGITTHTQVIVATVAVLPNTPAYDNGSAGVGATLTAGANAALVIDGVTVANGARVLVKNQVVPVQNGIYTVTQSGSGGAPWILTRAADFDMATAGEISPGAYVLAATGAAGNAPAGWVMNTLGPITVGATALNWAQFSAATVYAAGNGLGLSGATFSLSAPVSGANGGTGVANSGKTLTLGGNIAIGGAFDATFTLTATTNVTFPTSGTLWSSANVNGGSNCSGANFLQYASNAFSCTTAPTQQSIALGPGLTITRGADNAGPLVPGTNTLFRQDFPRDYTADRTVDITDIDYTLNANGASAITFTLPAATVSTGVAGSRGNGFCIRDKSGHGFTIAVTGGVPMYGMTGVNASSYPFSVDSFICGSSDGVAWSLSGFHGASNRPGGGAPKDYTADRTVDITDIDYTLAANGASAITFTLPAATVTTRVAGSKGNGFCIRDRSGHGFTITVTGGVAMYGMKGVSAASYPFSADSIVCPSSDGVAWALSGVHGASNLPVPSGGSSTDTVGNPLTAVGTGQSNCLALTNQMNRVTVSTATADPYNAVCLPVPTVGGHASVINRSANPIQVCPTTGVQINSLTVTTGCIQVNADNTGIFNSPITTEWDSN